jgi:hypothetical protein
MDIDLPVSEITWCWKCDKQLKLGFTYQVDDVANAMNYALD